MSTPSAPRHGWFKLPGQTGDRSVEDQLRGLAPALKHAKGKTVLDLGCAEGAIALAFAKAGATRVLGLEVVAGHVEVARELCSGYPCEFACVDLNKGDFPPPCEPFDIVLMLAVIHKLKHPVDALAWYAAAARELIVFRMPAFWQGSPRRPVLFQSERYNRELVNVEKILAGRGFALEAVERGPSAERGQEPVLYFRKMQTGAG